jgi:hypothetical protein
MRRSAAVMRPARISSRWRGLVRISTVTPSSPMAPAKSAHSRHSGTGPMLVTEVRGHPVQGAGPG